MSRRTEKNPRSRVRVSNSGIKYPVFCLHKVVCSISVPVHTEAFRTDPLHPKVPDVRQELGYFDSNFGQQIAHDLL